MTVVAALFVRDDSVYKTLPGVDCWDVHRDALRWPGGCTVVAHPPCRAWGRLKHFAKPLEHEPATGPWAVDMVRTWGGVLEHPAYSQLWWYRALPGPGQSDGFGWTLPVHQHWFGHRTEKATWLYIVGAAPDRIPSVPLRLGRPERVVSPANGLRKGMPGWRPHILKDEREHTPVAFAQFLVQIASICTSPFHSFTPSQP